MAKKAVCRWIAANLEPGKSSNIDLLDLVDRFNDHANSELAGLQISNSRLVSYLEETFRGAKFDEKTNRIHGVNWKKVKPVVYEPRPTRDKRDKALELRLSHFINDLNVAVRRGEMGFSTAQFANWRQSWLEGGFVRLVYDVDPFDEVLTWLESRGDLVERRGDLWFVVNQG